MSTGDTFPATLATVILNFNEESNIAQAQKCRHCWHSI